jgi:FSR family fosmidomycin resistance protein-like MFS transporter
VFSGFRTSFVFAHFFNHLVTALPAPMMPFIKQEFGLSYTQAGLVSAAFSLSYGISQLPAGYLTDRVGPRVMISISICGIGLSGLLIGLSHSYVLMLIFLVLMGISGGGYHPAAPPLLASTVPPAIRGKAFGFHMIGGTGAFFVAPLIAAGIAAAWGWRQSFIGLAIPSLIFGIAFYLLISRIIVPKKETAGITASETPLPYGWKRELALFIALAALVSSLSSSASFYTALFAQDRFGISAAAAAIFVAVLNSSGIWASPLGGYLSDRLGHIPAMLISCLAAGPIIYLLTVAPYGAGFVIVLLAWGALMSIRLPTTESYIMSRSSPKLRSTLFGVYYFSTQHGSGILTPLLGVLIDHIGFTSSFYILAVATLGVSLSIGAFLWRSRTKLVTGVAT